MRRKVYVLLGEDIISGVHCTNVLSVSNNIETIYKEIEADIHFHIEDGEATIKEDRRKDILGHEYEYGSLKVIVIKSGNNFERNLYIEKTELV